MCWRNSILRTRLLVFVGCLVSTGAVWAQSNLGHLLDLGAKKITPIEYTASLPVTVLGVWPDGKGEGVLTYFPDGKISGTEKHYASGASSGSKGKWTMTTTGKICTSVWFTSWTGTHEECKYLFRLGGDVYISMSDSARSAPVQKQITR